MLDLYHDATFGFARAAQFCRGGPAPSGSLRHLSCVHTTGRAFHSPCVVFLALIDPITLPKTASAGPYGESIEMEIQLVLMDTLAIINLCVGSRGGRWGVALQTNCCSRERTLC